MFEIRKLLWVFVFMTNVSCTSSRSAVEPSIQFTHLPPAGESSGFTTAPIEGRVQGARSGQRIVLFARSGVWWVQPLTVRPFTNIEHDSTWKNVTHPGNAYAALLVDEGYVPPPTTDALPRKGKSVLAVAVAESKDLAAVPVPTLSFGGYDWKIRAVPSDPGGSLNYYNPANASVDRDGFLHLQLKRISTNWAGAEVTLIRSLGYGSYRFVVRDISHLEAAAVLAFSTWDDNGPSREMNIEVSRWGEPSSKNAQYVIQPYYVPANVVRFVAPQGALAFSFQWEPGRVHFKTERGSTTVSEHVFTSGVPAAGKETVRINFYAYNNQAHPLMDESEVIIEKFEHLP
jgi:hypothetical protein